ncbi:hypothetical protein [Paenibacillus popilliae]|uniref:Uncharacterized protein n=1 Tax=Paenibacillus popilliae ATCC 14706 TaxID=1212764 RepID=M9M1G5_PAEPP|nr:hypothetical protein [Paenibacillus popilliae]GAC42729.1 hypothetical protein PPOP_2089 [Paenibacillus popilliae ATCC 14706]
MKNNKANRMSPANSKYVDAEFAAENTAADTGAARNTVADTEFGVESEGAASALNNPQANRVSKR